MDIELFLMENTSLQTIRWKDTGEEETQLFGIGEYVDGVNDKEDEEVFFWVKSMDEIYVGADFGDFEIIQYEND